MARFSLVEEEAQEEGSVPLATRGAELARDGLAALFFLLGRRSEGERERVARGALFFPFFAAGLGSLLAQLLDLLPALAPWPEAFLGTALLDAIGGGGFQRDFLRFAGGGIVGASALVVLLLGQAWGLAGLEGNLRTIALVLTPMLGLWAYVVQGYGSLAQEGDGYAAVFVKHMEFTQFATASVSAMALSLMLVNALGTMVLFAVASSTIVLRIVVHARHGGVSAVSLGAVCVIAQTISLLLAGSIGRFVAG